MRKGTTPTLTFELPFETEQIECVRIVFARDDKVVLAKTTEDCALDASTVTVRLTQEETFLFECDTFYHVQIRVKLTNGEVLASDILRLLVERCLDEEVI